MKKQRIIPRNPNFNYELNEDGDVVISPKDSEKETGVILKTLSKETIERLKDAKAHRRIKTDEEFWAAIRKNAQRP